MYMVKQTLDQWMKPSGRRQSLPKEQNSQVRRPQVDTTLESSLNGRRRCKGSVALISQANGQRRLFQEVVFLCTLA